MRLVKWGAQGSRRQVVTQYRPVLPCQPIAMRIGGARRMRRRYGDGPRVKEDPEHGCTLSK